MAKIKGKANGFTLIELLTVLAVITMLAGLLVPSLQMARQVAKETKQKAQFAAMEAALTAFRNDYGDYPPSHFDDRMTGLGCGAQKLCEAFLGLDLMGFHPRTAWRATGQDEEGTQLYGGNTDLHERRGHYLEMSTLTVVPVGDLYPAWPRVAGAWANLICDVFGRTKVTLSLGHRTIKVGAPVLYYRADPTAKTMPLIYNYRDNEQIIGMQDNLDGAGTIHPLSPSEGGAGFFYGDPQEMGDGYIEDPRVTAAIGGWPDRPESFLLISAGADGLYGTADDIRNFGN
jgi:prepilin-type N-terminal cleavage/methylation domain-containing protein